MTGPSWLLYGANGYTGALLAELAAARGDKPILAGRSEGKLRPLAERLGLPWRAVALDDATRLDEALREVRAVVHCAGPFSSTSAPMVSACLRAGAHYLDVTGEIDVFEAVFARHQEAIARGVALIPGVGFDVVPSDCLAAHLHQRLPSAKTLELAFAPLGGPSPGTLKTSLEAIPKGGQVRRGGLLVRVPGAHEVRTIAFADKPRTAMAIPWGDVSTAYRSTGIPDITVYMAASRGMISMAKMARIIGPILAAPAVLGFLQRQIDRRVPGPTPAARARGRTELWGRVADGERSATATMTTPEGYTLTAEAALASVRRVLAQAKPGAQTPSQAFGVRFAQSLPGVTLRDLP